MLKTWSSRSWFLSKLNVKTALLSGMLVVCFSVAQAAPADDFVTTWKTDNAGTSSSTSITIPTDAGSTYLYDVDWNNDNVFDQFGLTGDVTHDFGAAGTYTIRIQGTFPRILFNNGGDREKLLSVDQWGTQAWTSMNSAFYGCSNLQVLAADTPDLSGVGDIGSMFRDATTFNESIDAWDVSNVFNASSTFRGASSFNQPLNSWDASNFNNIISIFQDATSFNQPLNGWVTSSLVNINSAFSGATSFNQNINTWDTSGVNSFVGIFAGATSFNQPLNGWDVSSGSFLGAMFQGATSFDQSLNSWDTSAATNLNSMFSGATNFDGNITGWDVSNVTSFNQMFKNASNFNQAIGVWDVSSGTNFSEMFNNADSFNQSIDAWDMSSATNISQMLRSMAVFNQPLNSWNTSSVTSLARIFTDSVAFDQPLSGWDVSGVSGFAQVFQNTPFNQDISGWDMSGATDLSSMFRDADSFNQNISTWDTSGVTNMAAMFFRNDAFNQDIGAWDTSSVTSMSSMFRQASAFDQSLAGFEVQNVTNMSSMFLLAGLSFANYDSTLTSWAGQAVQTGVTLHAGSSQYCSSTNDRNTLVTTHSWAITDGGQICNPSITITAPTKASNAAITDTTIQVTDVVNINAANVVVDGASTVTTSAFSCAQTTPTQVDCTISVDTSGDLTITATNTVGAVLSVSELTYVVDTVPPVPSVMVDTTAGVDNPTITFSATDNVAVDHFELTYNTSNGAGGGVGAPTTINPATSPEVLVLDPDEAIHTITLRVYDTLGNFADQVISFPPVVTFTVPTPINNAAITDATVAITTPSGNDVTNITVTSYTGTSTPALSCTGNGADVTDPYAQPVNCTISGINDSGTLTVSADDFGNGATGQNLTAFVIETVDPAIAITAPTKSNNAAITNTTVVVTDNTAVNAGDVVITAVNTTGTFSISAVSCLQTTASQVDCTLQIDANEGTGDVRVTADDVAGNQLILDETAYTIDSTPPTTPAAAPDLQAASDSGTFNTDNVTNDNSPVFDVVCTEIGSTINVYSTLPVPSTLIGTGVCAAVGPLSIFASTFDEGVHSITYTDTDPLGNVSLASPALSFTLDNTDPAAPTINAPTFGQSIDTGVATTVSVDCNAINEIISVSNANLAPDPTTHTCTAAGANTFPVTWGGGAAAGSSQPLVVTLADLAGNPSSTNSVNVTIDDADGVSAAVEDAHPNGGDGNGDATMDSTQEDVSSLVNTVNAAYNTLDVTTSSIGDCGQVNSFSSLTESALTASDPSADFPIGLWDFQLTCVTPGDAIDVVIYLDTTYDTSSWVYKKFNSGSNTYSDISASVTYGTATVGASSVTTIAYTITDGGPLDEDGLANGIIDDPSGPSVASSTSSGGGGGGAPKNYPVDVCQSDGLTCTAQYPTKSAGTTQSYTDYLNCVEKSSSNPFDCTQDWLETNHLAECDTNGVCTAIIGLTAMTDKAPLPAATCETVKYQRYPEKRGRGVSSTLFTDAAPRHQAYQALIDLAEQEIVNGDADTGHARLDAYINRAEVVKIFTIAREDTLKLGSCAAMTHFPDVTREDWFHNFVQNMEAQNIVHGYEDGLYRPKRTINQAELFKIAALAFDYTTKEAADALAASQAETWFYPYTVALNQAEVIPDSLKNVAADTDLTRGDVFWLLSNVLKQIDQQ